MRIIFAIPLVYSNSGSFWERDLGLVVLALQKMGHDAWFCAIRGDEIPPEGRPLIMASRDEMSSPAWWKGQKPDAIVINTWSAPRHDAIRRAAVSVGCPVIEKLDTDGVKSPRIYPWHSLRRSWVSYDLKHPLRSGLPRKAESLARFLVTYLFPPLLDQPMIRCMERVPVYAAETPLASARVRRFLRMYYAMPMPRVVTVPHPVNMGCMGFSREDAKVNQVIVVGRWDDAVKGWKLLKETAERFLRVELGWKVLVVGAGAEVEGAVMERRFPGRFVMMGRLGHEELNRHLRASKVYLLTSHSETFNIAGAEALCCGCSVVGPAQIPSSAYFASCESGTVSYLRTPDHMADALGAEVAEWGGGARDPRRIAEIWSSKVGSHAVAEKYLRILKEMQERFGKILSGT